MIDGFSYAEGIIFYIFNGGGTHEYNKNNINKNDILDNYNYCNDYYLDSKSVTRV